MKNTYLLTLLVLPLSTLSTAYAVTGENFDFHGYMRSGIGTNNKGGDQICLNNPGQATPNGEFRLGNECSTYTELSFAAYNKKSVSSSAITATDKTVRAAAPKEKADESFTQTWKTQFLFAYNVPTDSDYEQTQPAFREAYVEGRGLFHFKQPAFWVGKRFYRDVNSNINDWYYFASTEGPGAGVTDIPLFWGKLNLAMLKRVDANTNTNLGNPAITVYDVRLMDGPLPWSGASLNLWLAYGTTPGGNTATTQYAKGHGDVLAGRYRQNLPAGFNDFTVMWGDKAMSGLNMYGTIAAGSDDNQTRSNRTRIIDDMTTRVIPDLDMHFTAMYEQRDTGARTNGGENWKSVAVRPMYFFTDEFSLASEIGYSLVVKESDGKKHHQLMRYTLAAQLSADRNIWARPVLRAFISTSEWNASNKGQINNGPYADSTSATMVGFQAEAWF